MTAPVTGGEALLAATARLRAAGVPDPARDARRLLDHAAPGWRPSEPLEDLAAYRDAVDRRERRQPVSQIVGRRAFWTHEFRVTPDVLDPRPETETLVAAALEAPFRRVLDLGTGSGCILLSLLSERPRASGTGTDVSTAALDVARGNAAMLGLSDRAAFAQADWTDGIEGPFDLIVSNPPYVAEAEMAGLAPELAWEPRGALTPGGDGLGAYRAIAADAPALAASGGRIAVEIGPTQAAAVVALFEAAGAASVSVRPDLDGRDRVVVAALGDDRR